MINREIAEGYVQQHLRDLGYEDVRIVSSKRFDDGVIGYDIVFMFRAEPEDYRGEFTVWDEDGEIRGEW